MANSELLPCPFCGGEAQDAECEGLWAIACFNFGCNHVQTEWMLTREEAVVAWNTRAERTCKNDAEPNPLLGFQVMFTCSECGSQEGMPGQAFRYCPVCGAKVVE